MFLELSTTPHIMPEMKNAGDESRRRAFTKRKRVRQDHDSWRAKNGNDENWVFGSQVSAMDGSFCCMRELIRLARRILGARVYKT